MLTGSLDGIVSNKEANKWHARTPASLDKQSHCFEGFCHQLHRDNFRDAIFVKVLSFVDSKLSNSDGK